MIPLKDSLKDCSLFKVMDVYLYFYNEDYRKVIIWNSKEKSVVVEFQYPEKISLNYQFEDNPLVSTHKGLALILFNTFYPEVVS